MDRNRQEYTLNPAAGMDFNTHVRTGYSIAEGCRPGYRKYASFSIMKNQKYAVPAMLLRIEVFIPLMHLWCCLTSSGLPLPSLLHS